MSDYSLILNSPPSQWTRGYLSDICDRVLDAASPSPTGNRLYLGLEHLASGQPSLVGRGTESDVSSGKTAFRKGDVLFGKLRPYLRKSAVAPEDGICSTDILVLRAKDDHSKYLCFLTHTNEFVAHAKSTTSGVQHPRTSWASLRGFKLHIPPANERQRIGSILELVQRRIEQEERMVKLTTELKKALLHQLFTSGLHNEPQKQTDLGPIPQTWQVTTLGEVAKFQTGGTPSRTNLDYWSGGDIPWIKTTEINYKVIEQAEELITRKALEHSAAKIFPKGTVVVAMYGQGVTRGRVGILGIDAATNQACAAITPYDEDQIASPFIYFFLEFHYDHLRQLGHGANQRNLNMALLKSFPVAFPTLDEQTEIVRTLRILDSKLETHHRKHAALSAMFGTLLHELMTARIRIQNLDLSLL